ncbi:MAG: glucan biosynthesis protein, partial [Chthoniobacter sp.]
VWRPLNNAAVMRHSVFAAHNIRGFGLLQRDREPTHYADIFNPYDEEPSLWIKPKGDWGDGEVHLLELPTNYEGLDNIAAFWNPKTKPAPLEPMHFGYDLLWTRERDFQLSENRVLATRVGAAGPDPAKRQVHIDFGGPGLETIAEKDPPTAVVSCSENAGIYETQVLPNPVDKTWRVILKFEPKSGEQGSGGFALHFAACRRAGERNLGLLMEPSLMNPTLAPTIAGRDWDAASRAVESYLEALLMSDGALRVKVVELVLAAAKARAAEDRESSATALAMQELDRLMTDWFAEVLGEPLPAGDALLSARGRLALLLADMPGQWQAQFLQPRPWPAEFARAMRTSFLHAGPDFQVSHMQPRPIDLGPIATLTQIGNLPYFRMLLAWLGFALLLVIRLPPHALTMETVLPTRSKVETAEPRLRAMPIAPRGDVWRVFTFFSVAVLLTGVGGMLFADLLWRTGWSPARSVLLLLFSVLFFLSSVGCVHGVLRIHSPPAGETTGESRPSRPIVNATWMEPARR